MLASRAGTAEGLDRSAVIPPLKDHNAVWLDQVGGQGEIQASVSAARLLDHSPAVVHEAVPLGLYHSKVTGDDEHFFLLLVELSSSESFAM